MQHRFQHQNRGPRSRVVVNQYIRFPELRVLSDRGEQLGVMSTRDALEQARAADKDLVLITEQAQPPVAKIIDLAKHKYQLQQKAAESRKNARKQDIKEIRLTPFMGDHDFETRLRKILEFLEDGDKVKLSVQFRGGRQLTKKDFGYNVVEKVVEATKELATIEIEPKMIGRKLIAQLAPTKKGKTNEKVQTENS